MKRVLLTLFLIITVLFEASILPPLWPFLVQPQFLLLILLSLEFADRSTEALYAAFLGGLLRDLLAATPVGFSSLFLVLIMGAVGLSVRFPTFRGFAQYGRRRLQPVNWSPASRQFAILQTRV